MSIYPYNYDDMLYRIHVAKTEDDNYKKINLPPLKVSKKNRTSVIANFGIYGEKINRTNDQIAAYFKAETGSANSINAQDQLVIQGALNEAKCESILKNYIRDFVMCKQCKCIETKLHKENGLRFIECTKCFAKTSLGKN